MRMRTAICVAATVMAWAAPATAQSLVEMALVVVVSTQDGVVEDLRLSTELKEQCARDAELAGLCAELDALEGEPGSLAMVSLLELDALQLEAWPVKWKGMQQGDCPVQVDGLVGHKTAGPIAKENVYIRGFGSFSVKKRTTRAEDAYLTAFIDWNGNGDFEQQCVDAMQDWIGRGSDAFFAETDDVGDEATDVAFLYSVEVEAVNEWTSTQAGGGRKKVDPLRTIEIWGY